MRLLRTSCAVMALIAVAYIEMAAAGTKPIACTREDADRAPASMDAVCNAIIADATVASEVKASAYRRRGYGRMMTSRLEEALADFTAGLSLDGVSANTRSHLYRLRSQTHRRSGSFDEAVRDARRAIEADPQEAGAYIQMANLDRALGRTEAELESWSKAVAVAPDSAQNRMHRAMAYLEAHEFDLALADATVVLQQDHKHLRSVTVWERTGRTSNAHTLANFARAIALASLERADEGLNLLDTLVSAYPVAESYRARAQFLIYRPQHFGMRSGDAEAIADLQVVLRSNPNDHASWWELSRLLVNEKRFAEAHSAIAIAIDRDHSQAGLSPTYHWTKADVFRREQKFESAAASLKASWELFAANDYGWAMARTAERLQQSGYLRRQDLSKLTADSPAVAAAIAGCMRDERCN